MGGTIISTMVGGTTPTKGRKTPRKHEDIDGQGGAERGAARRGRGPAVAPPVSPGAPRSRRRGRRWHS